MTIESIKLISETSYIGLSLRTATWSDQDSLRFWKNSQRSFFFHNEIISPEQQFEWFGGYLSRPNDFMFIVHMQDVAIGCIGVRFLEQEWDVYNAILGNSEYGKKGFMRQGLDLVLRFAYAKQSCSIRLKVLKINPAVSWYQKNGFVILSEGDGYFVMQHNRAVFAE